jgi:hypothetical protein
MPKNPAAQPDHRAHGSGGENNSLLATQAQEMTFAIISISFIIKIKLKFRPP